MGHYGRGDNYNRFPYGRGDYYKGDPGFLGSLFKGVTGAIKGFVTGGPSGAISGAIGGLVGSGSHKSLPKPAVTPALFTGGTPPLIGGGGFNGGGFDVDVPADAGAGAMIPAFSGPGGPTVPTKGYHPNKSTYETRGGGTSHWPHQLVLHPKGSVLVRNRRMNVGNARALKRALRRAGGFARLARRVMSFTHPRAGKGHFKLKRRAKR